MWLPIEVNVAEDANEVRKKISKGNWRNDRERENKNIKKEKILKQSGYYWYFSISRRFLGSAE